MKRPFEHIIELHAATVLRVCTAVVGQDDADDAWQDTFVSAMRAYPALPETANIEAWLVTIAHRKAIDITRARTRRAITVDELPERPSSLGVPGAATDDLWDAVGRLPERQKQAVAYHYFAGLPYRDVAEIIGGSDEAARKAASDGIATLRRTFVRLESKGENSEQLR